MNSLNNIKRNITIDIRFLFVKVLRKTFRIGVLASIHEIKSLLSLSFTKVKLMYSKSNDNKKKKIPKIFYDVFTIQYIPNDINKILSISLIVTFEVISGGWLFLLL